MHLILAVRFALTRLTFRRFAWKEKQKEPLKAGVIDMVKARKRNIEKRTRRLNVFFDSREYAQLLEEARLVRMRPSELVRQKFFTTSPPSTVPDLNLEVWTRLAPAAANLNQIARYLNSGMRLDVNKVSRILAEFRMSLVVPKG